MAINLTKGQRVDLTKGNPNLTNLVVGLGWDPVASSSSKGGFLSSLFGGGASNASIDCDASVLLLGENGKIQSNKDVIYFGNLKSDDASVTHTGDNLTGDGDGDDEQILIDLKRVSPSIHKILFVVNIYNAQKRNQHFGMIQNAFIRIVNKNSNQEMLRYNLTENYSGSTCLVVGEIYRQGSDWKFAAIGNAITVSGLQEVVKSYA